MAFNKKKALEEASKLVSQRRIPQAIKHYQLIAENDPQDLALLNIIGDLCVREGNNSEALRQFHKLADAYTSEGFILKAIAIYKKIAKLDSQSVDTIVRLAELYATQKLSHEANEQYAQALALCQRNSLRDRAGQILRKLLSQDPANTTYRLKLAEHYRGAGQTAESGAAYLEAARTFYGQKNILAANAALKKATEVGPETVDVALLQARLAAESGRYEEVEQKINGSHKLKSTAEGLSVLMAAYLGSGRLDRASALAIEACRDRPEGFGAVKEFAAHCNHSRRPDAALPVFDGIAGLVPEAVKLGEFADLLQQSLDARPHDATSLDRLSDLCTRICGENVPPALLEALGKAYGAAGEWNKAQSVFQRLRAQDEGNPAWQSLLEESIMAAGGPGDTGPQQSAVDAAPSQTVAGTPAAAQSAPAKISPVASEAAGPMEVGVDLDFSREWASYAAAPPAGGGPSLPPSLHEAVSVADEGKAEVEFYLDHGLLAEASAALDQLSLKFPGHSYAVELRDRLASLAAAAKEKPEPFSTAQESPIEPPPPLALAESRGASEPGEPPDYKLGAFAPGIEQGFPPLLAESSSPGSPVETGETAPSRFTPGDASVLNGLARDLENSWDFDAGPVEPGGEMPPPAQSEPGLGARAGSALDELADHFETSVGEPGGIATPPFTPQSASEPAASLFDSSLEELLAELNAGEEPASADDTPQTHYNLGVAFREMGLLDEAISEFQKVVKGAISADSSPLTLEACSMLGICFMEKEMPHIAVRWLLRALESHGLNEDTTLALTYDLATAYERSGDRKAALEKFSEVYSVNIDYRDVADKIQSLQSKRA